MIEMSPARKNKISLSDYNYRRDIENRLLMAQFSILDLEVLEEILYSPIKISIRKLAKNIDLDETDLLPILEKLSKTGLITLHEEEILVDKEMRKYYESQIQKFDDDFKPGMEFLQSLLRKVPIHVLPTWYCIPRTSNNIFDSLVERYLFTPQVFQRYLLELNLGDPNLSGMIHDVYHSPDLWISSKDLIDKYGLTREQFEEYMLHLEFNFVCCLGYKKAGDIWKEIVTPFYEWAEYLRFLRNSETPSIKNSSEVVPTTNSAFGFIEDLSSLLQLSQKDPIKVDPTTNAPLLKSKIQKFSSHYAHRLISKLRLIKLAEVIDGKLYVHEPAENWLKMSLEERALYIYRHPLNRLCSEQLPAQLCTEKNIREAEKSILRVLDKGWVYFDDFIKGVLISFNEQSMIALKRFGKSWKYTLPEYSNDEKELIKATIFNWLFEAGIVLTGTHQGKECFCVTSFGQSLFGR